MTSGEGDPRIGSVLTHRHPFGPTATEATSKPARILLFEDDNRLFREGLERRPQVIVGRRGSGKTAFLDQLKLGSGVVPVDLPTASLVTQFDPLISAIEPRTSAPEVYAEFWEAVLMVAVVATFVNPATSPCNGTAPELDTLRRFILSFAKEDYGALRVVARFVEEILADAKDDSSILAAPMEFVRGATSVQSATDTVQAYFQREGLKLCILLDSTERDELMDERRKPAFGGLLKFLGSQSGRGTFELCMAFPAEHWHKVRTVSTNLDKDLSNPLVLHWHPRELQIVAARRLLWYLNEHHPASIAFLAEDMSRHSRFELKSYEQAISRLDDHGTSNQIARALFSSVFPPRIQNRFGARESSYGYVMRHTQLLPRQLLGMLNQIWHANSLEENGVPWRISDAAITSAIASEEGRIVTEICNAYKQQYPNAHEALQRLVPNLPNCFPNGDLQKAYSRFVKGRVDLALDEDSPWHFKRMLVEIGAVGAVQKRTDYVEAEFEYTKTNQLLPSESTELCFHPLVSGALREDGAPPPDDYMPVFPRGTAMSDADERNLR